MSYGPNTPDLFRRAAEYVDRILRAKPADIPRSSATKSIWSSTSRPRKAPVSRSRRRCSRGRMS
jgi:putative ABC transport system substrate-binding protein